MNNPNTDKFNCNDRYGVSKNAPIFDTIRNTIDISTQIIKKNVSDTVTTATFIAVFDRPVNTGDLKDLPLLTGSQNLMIWAFGPIASSSIVVHGDTTTSRGSGNIFYLSLPPIAGALHLASGILIATVTVLASIAF